ncbi:nek6 si:ch211- NIMA (never in mitosis gene a)-related kinase 6 [Paramuricea clavata]|uniref:Nek6 si:ch211- NIMA (Never in mitosis gene a)-related kinase 6, partial n=1 Tax=Paramuricea clavata TaxID=317549 RepID=A0A6S7GZE6_PARCT|nr:nek6 si:ch211- NIMA (never in mitosis gene a)-related kinase 6 [Paramuricea clavata]
MFSGQVHTNEDREFADLGAVGEAFQVGQTANIGEESFVGRRAGNISNWNDDARRERAQDLKRSRAGHLSRLTRLYREINNLTSTKDSLLQPVIEKRIDLDVAFERFKQVYYLYVAYLTDNKVIEDEQWIYESRVREHNGIFQNTDQWIQRTKLNLESEIRAEDSISQISSHNPKPDAKLVDSQSHAGPESHASSQIDMGLGSHTNTQSHASPQIDMSPRSHLQQLQKLQELELKKLRVKGEEDTLKLQNEYEQAILSERIWGQAEEVISREEKQELPKLVSRKDESPKSGQPLPFIPGTYLERKHDIGISEDVKGQNDKSEFQVNSDSLSSKPSSFCPSRSSANVGGQEILKSVVGILNEGFNMPKPELLTFDGNPLHYWRFINNFQTNIANETMNPGKHLAYLIQRGKGEAREAIENCSILDPGRGYLKAREILQQQFGRRHVVAQSHIKQIVDGVQIKSLDGASLQKLARQMQNCELTLSKMGWSDELNNSETLLRIVDRLPSFMQLKWAEKAESILKSERRPRFSDLAQFIQDKADVAANMFGKHVLEARKKATRDLPKGRIKETARATTLATANKEVPRESGKTATSRCLLCSHDHELSRCDEFKKKSYEERVQIIRSKRICNNCFKSGHFARSCLEKKLCELLECRRKHHTLLHPPNPGPETSSQKNQMVQVDVGSSAGVCSMTCSKRRDVCLRIVPVKVGNPDGRKVETYALLDSGSEVSLCDRRLINKLGLDGVEKQFTLTTLNEEKQYRNGLEVNLEVSNLNNEHSISLEGVWSVEALPVSSKAIPVEEDLKKWTHLSDLEFPRIETEDVMLLIGADTPEAFWVMEERRGERGEPCAIKSPLGWALFGPTAKFKDSESGMPTQIEIDWSPLQTKSYFGKRDSSSRWSPKKCTDRRKRQTSFDSTEQAPSNGPKCAALSS